jgi:hypothetical protein
MVALKRWATSGRGCCLLGKTYWRRSMTGIGVDNESINDFDGMVSLKGYNSADYLTAKEWDGLLSYSKKTTTEAKKLKDEDKR